MKCRSNSSRAAVLTATGATVVLNTTVAAAYTVFVAPAPAGSPGSEAFGIAGAELVGITGSSSPLSTSNRATLWHASSASPIDLHPTGYTGSDAKATTGMTQVGEAVTPDGHRHAIRWTGSAASAHDLHPTGYTQSTASAIAGTQITGAATLGSLAHAALWIGSTFVDLHPAADFVESHALATDGMRQAGSGRVGSSSRALLWNGAADSVIDLHPSGYDSSFAFALAGNQAAGYTVLAGGFLHAAVWDLATMTFSDLNGPLAQSAVLGTNGTNQVGSLVYPGTSSVHAARWSGTADSLFDLHAFLPTTFTYSRATAIDPAGNIAGVGLDSTTNSFRAIAWLVPEPTLSLPAALACVGLTRRPRRR